MIKKINSKKQVYYEGLGRRKESVARVRIKTDLKDILVNEIDYQKYFPTEIMKETAISPLSKLKITDRFGVTVHVKGGGLNSQSQAMRLGLARSLVKLNPEYKSRLLKLGFLKRDPREKERKKFGLKKARRAPQWAKR